MALATAGVWTFSCGSAAALRKGSAFPRLPAQDFSGGYAAQAGVAGEFSLRLKFTR